MSDEFDAAMRRALIEDHAKLEALMGDDAPPAPQFFGPCWCCDGTGDSGEVSVNEAPATWDDPGWYEVDAIPCNVCGGTGLLEITEHVAQPSTTPAPDEEEIAF